MYATPTKRDEEIQFGATLPPDAIRSLHDHTVARLRAAWDEADENGWSAEVRTAQGRTVPAEETLWMRAREVWIHAVDLGKTAGFSDFPEEVLTTLFSEIPGKWRSAGTGHGLVLVDTDHGTEVEVLPPDGGERVEISGALPGLVRWATGRGIGFVEASTGDVPAPPRWL